MLQVGPSLADSCVSDACRRDRPYCLLMMLKFTFKINRVEDGVLLQQAVDLIAVWANAWQLSIYTILSVSVICLILDVLAVN